MKIHSRPCIICKKEFESNFKRKKYCSKECFRKIRKLQHAVYSKERHRVKTGVYEKWAGELRKVGYVVIKNE